MITVLLSDRSGLGGDTRPVGDQGETRLGSREFGDHVYDRVNIGIMLANQALIGCCWAISEIAQGAGSSCTGLFHDAKVDHGGGDVGMTEKVLNRSRPHRSAD